MTVLTNDRIEMADSDELDLDLMFRWLDQMPVPEGFKAEIVGGVIYMSPQREVHWRIIRRIVRALEDACGMDVVALSDVRIDFPGKLNGLAPDVAKVRADAVRDGRGRWRCTDVEFVAEVISQITGPNDYGPKKDAYAAAEVSAYLVVDPYVGRCHLYSEPKDGEYARRLTVDFGGDVDLTAVVPDLTLATDEFPRD